MSSSRRVIEDSSGARIAAVDARPASLAYAGSTRYEVFWTAGSVAAGSYVARVTAFAGSDVVATATAAFELTRTVTLTLDVVSDRPSYEQGDAVTLLTRVVNVESNTPLRDLSLHYRVVDPSAAVVFETIQPVGYLAIGSSASSEAVWPSGANEPGAYTVSVEAREAAELVASSGTDFEMAAASA